MVAAELTITTVFLAGILSFVSPCVLPLVPPYLTYLAGVSIDEMVPNRDGSARMAASLRGKVLTNAAVFVAGFSVVFVALGAGASTIGMVVRSHLDTLAIVAGVIIILMGLHFLGLLRINLFYREARFQLDPSLVRGASLSGSFLMGLAFAFGWTPCIGPVLGAVLGVAATGDSAATGAWLLFVYSMGLGVPFLLAALFAEQFMGFLSRFRRHLGTVEKVMGGMLVLTGILFLTGGMQVIAFWMLETFPALQQVEGLAL
ncbi:MAG: cytochrome c biogenesis protein CcdA [Pseudomonadota bacterium]